MKIKKKVLKINIRAVYNSENTVFEYFARTIIANTINPIIILCLRFDMVYFPKLKKTLILSLSEKQSLFRLWLGSAIFVPISETKQEIHINSVQ